jgi:hypothetical protein
MAMRSTKCVQEKQEYFCRGSKTVLPEYSSEMLHLQRRLQECSSETSESDKFSLEKKLGLCHQNCNNVVQLKCSEISLSLTSVMSGTA